MSEVKLNGRHSAVSYKEFSEFKSETKQEFIKVNHKIDQLDKKIDNKFNIIILIVIGAGLANIISLHPMITKILLKLFIGI